MSHSSASIAYIIPSSHSPFRCRESCLACCSRRMPSRSISRHDATLSAKHWAMTRRTPISSKQIRSSSRTASVA